MNKDRVKDFMAGVLTEQNQQKPLRVENKSSYYLPYKSRAVRRLTVEFILDGVPGPFNQPEDLMKWIAVNPYVVAVEEADDS